MAELFPDRLIVLEIVYSALASELTPVIVKVTLETVSAEAEKFSNIMSKLIEVVGQSS